MKAFRLTRWGTPAELTEMAVPEPGPGQVLIKVAASGACHSDLHLMAWPEGLLPWKLPFTLGHENTGWIEKTGPGVELRKGDAVIVYGPWGCGQCRPCRLGRENYCERATEIKTSGGGLGLDGGMAEYMLVPSARYLVPLGDLDPVRAAPLADAGLTPYHAITTSMHRLPPGSTAVVIGCGGLGQMAIQLLRVTTGARVIAVDTDERKLQIASSLGADLVVRSGIQAVAAIRSATHNVGADVVLDMVGADATLALGAKALRSEGRLVLIGLAGGKISLGFFDVPYGAEVATSYWGTLTELMELVALARADKLRLEIETYPLSKVLAVYDKLRRGDVVGRAVICPDR
ncbi:MAG TPA: NAD(P)-dependent alcohol dehydrogenase [Kofleriaceae bacterium]|nr:NAD(P)-dependent alcohol dehydrogenase [Kofleriaceae bacterium]